MVTGLWECWGAARDVWQVGWRSAVLWQGGTQQQPQGCHEMLLHLQAASIGSHKGPGGMGRDASR